MIFGKRTLFCVIALQIAASCSPHPKNEPRDNQPDESQEADAASGPPQLTQAEFQQLHRAAQNGEASAMVTLIAFSSQWLSPCVQAEFGDCNRVGKSEKEKIRLYQRYVVYMINRSNKKESVCHYVLLLADTDIKIKLEKDVIEKAWFYIDNCLDSLIPSIDRENRKLVEDFYDLDASNR